MKGPLQSIFAFWLILLAGCTPLHKRRLAAADVRPCCDPSLLH